MEILKYCSPDIVLSLSKDEKKRPYGLDILSEIVNGVNKKVSELSKDAEKIINPSEQDEEVNNMKNVLDKFYKEIYQYLSYLLLNIRMSRYDLLLPENKNKTEEEKQEIKRIFYERLKKYNELIDLVDKIVLLKNTISYKIEGIIDNSTLIEKKPVINL